MQAQSRWAKNPFFVLEVAVDYSRGEIERSAQKLLALIEIGSKVAANYATPFGAMARDADLVRWAAAELRDPVSRVQHEFWAHIDTSLDDSRIAEDKPSVLHILKWTLGSESASRSSA